MAVFLIPRASMITTVSLPESAIVAAPRVRRLGGAGATAGACVSKDHKTLGSPNSARSLEERESE